MDDKPIVFDTRKHKLPESERLENRRRRAEYYFAQYANGKTFDEIAATVGLTTAHVRNERKWYITNCIPPEQAAEILKRKYQIRKEEAEERRRLRAEQRLNRARHIADELIGGKTIDEVASELGFRRESIYPILHVLDENDPEYAAKYHAAARTHHFGHHLTSRK
ncbi:hypothetical protein [Bifidobacterium oedipodis]|uniref:Uncharacterized protein n=1 Tax=Bifidobacterium oedipodis TaxID=2675322 RepID=A0A7Y0EQU0_9BIFI|nr:hypothetical protein [Bifidobacterium sp. DSM 109957]NMM94690.1 hypothetical protein [Bifidobacterium sp. DSM 109957]